jgi:hypothetical protein
MIRPSRFFSNPETVLDNAFQREETDQDPTITADRARGEFDQAVAQLRAAGITVRVFEDTAIPAKPDAVFPNNWFSTHEDGRVALYPMATPSRRAERRRDLIEQLRENYRVSDVIDYSGFEERGLFLEGTGSLVLDYVHRLAYVSLSRRAAREPLEKFCADFGYEPITFQSTDEKERPIYHTNVMMCLGSEFALIGLDLIRDRAQRMQVRGSLERTGKNIVELSAGQIENFVGNGLELQNEREKLLILSERAVNHLTAGQRATLERFTRLVPLALPTIELAGGSARCILAGIHLPPRQDR